MIGTYYLFDGGEMPLTGRHYRCSWRICLSQKLDEVLRQAPPEGLPR